MNWILSPATVFAASPVVPVMVIDKVEDAVPMAKALAAGGITVFEITLRTVAALDAIRAIRAAMPEALVGAGTILNQSSMTRRSPLAHNSSSLRVLPISCWRMRRPMPYH